MLIHPSVIRLIDMSCWRNGQYIDVLVIRTSSHRFESSKWFGWRATYRIRIAGGHSIPGGAGGLSRPSMPPRLL